MIDFHDSAWPPGRPRVLVTDAWLANAGDGAIALATQRRIARVAPAAAVLHAAYQGDLLGRLYRELTVVPPLAALLATGVEASPWPAEAGRQLVADADVVLSQGGGFAMEHYRGAFERYRAWELVLELGVPLGFGAQTVGPFRRAREREVLSRVYAAATIVALRDPASQANVRELGAPAERVVVTADEAFGLYGAPSGPVAPRRGVACVLTRHPSMAADGAVAEPDVARDVLVETLRVHPGEHVTLLSTQQGLGGRGLEDDGELGAAVVATLPPALRARVRLLRGYIPPWRFVELLAMHRGVVSMRMHPAIFALSAGVPAVVVSDAFKISEMFRALGLGDVVVPAGEVARAAQRLGDLGRAPPALDLALERSSDNDRVVRRLLESVGRT
jgi:hypothetical protein